MFRKSVSLLGMLVCFVVTSSCASAFYYAYTEDDNDFYLGGVTTGMSPQDVADIYGTPTKADERYYLGHVSGYAFRWGGIMCRRRRRLRANTRHWRIPARRTIVRGRCALKIPRKIRMC